MGRTITVRPILDLFSVLRELILAYSAKGTLKVLGKILKLSAGSDAALGAANLLVIFPSANVANVFHIGNFLSLSVNLIKARARERNKLAPQAPG